MTISEKEEELFKQWEKSRRPFVRDGAVSERDYQQSKPRIAFILKEANDPGDIDLREFLRDGGRGYTWNNVARWVHGIRNLPSEFDGSFYEQIDEGFRREMLGGIVVMNLKKSPGGARTVFKHLETVAREDADIFKSNMPSTIRDITICGGVETTAGIFQKRVHPKMSWQQTTGGIWWYWRNAQKLLSHFFTLGRVSES